MTAYTVLSKASRGKKSSFKKIQDGRWQIFLKKNYRCDISATV